MLKSLGNAILDLVFPQSCALCGLLGPVICDSCKSQFPQPIPHRQVTKSLDPLDEVIFCGDYGGLFSHTIPALKYTRKTNLGTPLASYLAETYWAMQCDEYEGIIAVPLHWRRQWWRGFNQSEILCEKLPKERLMKHSLLRQRYTKQQVRLKRDERKTNIVGAIAVRQSKLILPKSILLVDDVMTTGSTLQDCARALKESGVERIGALVLACEYREPKPSDD